MFPFFERKMEKCHLIMRTLWSLKGLKNIADLTTVFIYAQIKYSEGLFFR